MASQIVRLTLTIGLLTVLATGTMAIVSTSRLSIEKADGRETLAIRDVEDLVAGRLRQTQIVLEEVSARAVITSPTATSPQELAALLRENAELIPEAYVADTTGRVVASIGAQGRRSVNDLVAFEQVRLGRGGFIADDESGPEVHDLWFARAAISPDGVPLFVLGRIDLGFLAGALDTALLEIPQGAAAVLDGPRVVVERGQWGLDTGEVRWRPASEVSGRLDIAATSGVALTGRYSDIQGLEGLAWRVAVVAPRGSTLEDTMRAVTPSIAVLIVGGVFALLAAWLVSRRLVRPLAELEATARIAAAGSIVEPLVSERDDEIGRLAEAFNALALRINALHDLSQLLARATRLDQVLDAILSAMGHIVGPGAAAIYLLERGGSVLRPSRTRGIDLAGAKPIDMNVDGWLKSALYESGPTEIELATGTESSILPGLEGSHAGLLAAPLVSAGIPLGVVVVMRDTADPLSEAEREMVKTFSAQAAVAVTTSRLFEEESESRHVAEALKAVAEQLVRPDGLDAALATVEEIVRDVLRATFARVVLVDRRVLGLQPLPEPARDGQLLSVGLRVLRDTQAPIAVERGKDEGCDRLLTEFGAGELLFVPIGLEGEHGALMVVALPHEEHGRRALEIAQVIGDEIALALDNAYLYERAVSRAANLETIFRISQAVGSSLQVNVVLNRVLDVVAKILSADAVALLSYDPRKRTLSTAMARGLVPSSILHLDLRSDEDLPGHVFTSGEPVALRDLHAGLDGIAGSAAAGDLGSLLAVPLLARGRSIGVLMVFATQRGVFSDEDMNVLQTFASQAALALDTARLYSREHQVASVLQQSILPDALPDIPEIEAASVYEPAGGDAEIGGDYYDLFRSADGCIWFSIADVCGKGVVAATKTSMIKYAVRAFVAAGLSPREVLAEVNRMSSDTGDPSDIVTALVAEYRPDERVLIWANGGHPPGLVRTPAGEIISLSATGPLLGALAEAPYDEETVEFVPGSVVLLYTDGVTEARHGNTFFGEERVKEVLGRGLDANDTAFGLVEYVKAFSITTLRDDVAVLVVAANPLD